MSTSQASTTASRFASVSTTERSARDPLQKGWITGLDVRIIAGREGPLALATLSLGAAAIHFAVISEHFTEYWVFGVFFAALGWYQAIWAVLYTLRPGRMLGFTALLVNAGTVALWLWTRTVGVPIGPNAGELEPIGAPDVAATVFEAAIVIGLLWYVFARRPASPRASTTSPSRMWLLGGLIVLVTTTTALVLFLPSS
jgi:hypothetical protein